MTSDDLERFRGRAWWTGRLDEAIGLRERSDAGFSGGGRQGQSEVLAETWGARSPCRKKLAPRRTPFASSSSPCAQFARRWIAGSGPDF